MSNPYLKKAPQFSINNHFQLSISESCGCYQCLEIMSPKEITLWTDKGKTAICPKCNCDCIIPKNGPDLTKEILSEIHNSWFKKV